MLPAIDYMDRSNRSKGCWFELIPAERPPRLIHQRWSPQSLGQHQGARVQHDRCKLYSCLKLRIDCRLTGFMINMMYRDSPDKRSCVRWTSTSSGKLFRICKASALAKYSISSGNQSTNLDRLLNSATTGHFYSLVTNWMMTQCFSRPNLPTDMRPTSRVPAIDALTTGISLASSPSKTLSTLASENVFGLLWTRAYL